MKIENIKPVKVPLVLVASSSKAKKRRKGPFIDVELIVDPTRDDCLVDERRLYSLPNPHQVLPGSVPLLNALAAFS